MSTPAHRLKLLRQSAGFIAPRAAAVTHGWDVALYASHEEGRRNLTIAAAKRYASAFGGTAGYILFGEGGLPLPAPGLTVFACDDVLGVLSYLEALRRMKSEPSSGAPTPLFNRCFGVIAEDNSMTEKPDSSFVRDSIAEGDTVVFHPELDLQPGCLVLAIGHNLRIRRWQPARPDGSAEDRHGRLVAANPYVSGIEKIYPSTVIAAGRGVIRPFSTVVRPEVVKRRKRS